MPWKIDVSRVRGIMKWENDNKYFIPFEVNSCINSLIQCITPPVGMGSHSFNTFYHNFGLLHCCLFTVEAILRFHQLFTLILRWFEQLKRWYAWIRWLLNFAIVVILVKLCWTIQITNNGANFNSARQIGIDI